MINRLGGKLVVRPQEHLLPGSYLRDVVIRLAVSRPSSSAEPDELLPDAWLRTHFNDGDKARGREVQMAVEMSQHGDMCMSINYKLWNKGIKSIQPINP